MFVNNLLIPAFAAVLLLGGCTYADQRFVSSQSQQQQLYENRLAIQKAEREERAERRAERREEMMDEADAVNRAYKGLNGVYLIR
ncbi:MULTISPECIES: hypothetical protein [Neisseria]|uniref:hypothetical protein n=1 Tax=unclassified Neisseria TaxID=2623750 RepID=UPI001071A6E2|nr:MULTISPECIES: hypothetical protein [Neisseria]MBF0804074.1 hypothetical protein [Neisseria sp. 19428wB4_WF04]TFU43218.1 hypothetical protein E4T99_06835 [Neisseria sp. WF04]